MKLHLEKFLNVGSAVNYPTRAFCSVLPLSGTPYFQGMIREFDTRDSGAKTDIRCLGWDEKGKPNYDQLICSGEDPRQFCWQDRMWTMFVTWSKGASDWELHLIREDGKHHRGLTLIDSGFNGKNWVPVVYEDTLWIIRSIQPLVVLEVDIETGVCMPVNNQRCTREIGEYRGGGNALYRESTGVIFGFGHRTTTPNRHQMFYYEVNPDCNTTTKQLIDPPPELADVGILDPTSHWIDDKGEFIGVCASQTQWNDYQLIRHAILRVKR